jgi:hypothetical protein
MLLALAVSPMFCAIGVVQVFGLAAAAVARLTEGTRHECGGQCLCLAALALVGTVCGVAIQFGPGAAGGAGAPPAVMTLIAVIDIAPRR